MLSVEILNDEFSVLSVALLNDEFTVLSVALLNDEFSVLSVEFFPNSGTLKGSNGGKKRVQNVSTGGSGAPAVGAEFRRDLKRDL